MSIKEAQAELLKLVRAELAQPVADDVRSLARAVAQRHGRASIAVLFYGSCLRESDVRGLMLDFYLIVDDYGRAYGSRWMAWANRLVPPNVFPIEHRGFVATYAVRSEEHRSELQSLMRISYAVFYLKKKN